MAVGLGDDELVGGSHSRSDSKSISIGRGAGGGKMHYLAKCILRGSAVLQAVRGHLRSPSSSDIVFGKETSLELVAVDEDGIVQSICEQTVFGIIKDLAILPWNEKLRAAIPQAQRKDLLLVLSDSGKLSFLSFFPEMHRFFAMTHIELSKPGNSLQQLGRMLAVHSDGSFIAVAAFEDSFALFPVSKSAGSNIVGEKILYPSENEGAASIGRDCLRANVRGSIWSMCFISNGCTHLNGEGYNPVLAILMHRKGALGNDLILFGCNYKTRSMHVLSQYSEAGPLALSVSAVPHLPGFVYLFRMGDALLMDLRDPQSICCLYRINFSLPAVIEEGHPVNESCGGIDVDDEGMFNVAACALLELRDSLEASNRGEDPMSIDSGSGKVIPPPKFVSSLCWEPGDLTNSKMMFCLDTGELFMIEMQVEHDEISVSISGCLYSGLPCKALLWVDGGLIAGLVEMGDGMVLKLEHGSLLYKSPIQNIAPILDLSVVDYHEEKQDQMFACCGMSPEGSLRIIRSGISVERLLRTPPIYQGMTGIWSLKIKKSDPFHSFLVLSFVEETRILSVGLSFVDVSDAAGFKLDACTLACGLVADGLLVQIHRSEVRLCLPTTLAHPGGVPLPAPICTSWYPHNSTISKGAVGHNVIIVATSSPSFLFILGVRSHSDFHYEIYEIQNVRLKHEVSCISIPEQSVNCEQLNSAVRLHNNNQCPIPQSIANISGTFVIGTHKPSVEILSFVPEEGMKVLAVATISISNSSGAPITGCIPEDVRLVSVDRSYVLSGLRNGMLLRFEWPEISAASESEQSRQSQFTSSCYGKGDCFTSSAIVPHYVGIVAEIADSRRPVILQLIAIRRIGITPVFLVPLRSSLYADILVLSDRPWLLHSARHSLAYTSISFQPATHVTPVCSGDCPMGILFVAENALHLVEMVHSKRLNVQKFSIEGTPRKVLYHSESKTLLVMRTGLTGASCSSDVCRVDPLTGAVLSNFKFETGETAKCMQIVKFGSEQVLIVGTSQCAGRTIMHSGEAGSTRGRVILLGLDSAQISESSSVRYSSSMNSASQTASPFRETVGYATDKLSSSSLCSSPEDNNYEGIKLEEMETGQLRFISQSTLSGAVLAVCPYLDRFVLASAGNMLVVFGFPNENSQRLRKLAVGKMRFTITSLATQSTRIAVGDCRDGVLFFSYNEDFRKLEQLYSDPVQRLVADCTLIDVETAVVSDRKGSISILSCSNHFDGNESPEKNLMINGSFYVGETVMSIRKGSFRYRLPVDDVLNRCDGTEIVLESACSSIVASTLLGSVLILIPISSEEHELLEAVQAKLAVHPLTSPTLGNDHKEFRGRGSQGVATILDGDMLAQFLELTSMQQESVLASPCSPNTKASPSNLYRSTIPVSQVVRLLERVYYALN